MMFVRQVYFVLRASVSGLWAKNRRCRTPSPSPPLRGAPSACLALVRPDGREPSWFQEGSPELRSQSILLDIRSRLEQECYGILQKSSFFRMVSCLTDIVTCGGQDSYGCMLCRIFDRTSLFVDFLHAHRFHPQCDMYRLTGSSCVLVCSSLLVAPHMPWRSGLSGMRPTGCRASRPNPPSLGGRRGSSQLTWVEIACLQKIGSFLSRIASFLLRVLQQTCAH